MQQPRPSPVGGKSPIKIVPQLNQRPSLLPKKVWTKATIQCAICNETLDVRGQNEFYIGREFANTHFKLAHPHRYKQLNDELRALMVRAQLLGMGAGELQEEGLKVERSIFRILTILTESGEVLKEVTD